jgi:activating signal cointegrator 1
MELKALSLWQPWASLIYDGRKTIETRSWKMWHRGPLAIHAAKRIEKDACASFGYDWRTIPSGSILCIVDVVDCVRFPSPKAPPDEYGDFSEGRFGFLLKMLEKFPVPIPARGMQGIWTWDREARQ